MSSTNRNIIRSVVLIIYVLIIGGVIYGISSVFSYLNTGADRTKILHTEIKKVDYYLPKVAWTSLENEGRPMDKETQKNIEEDYLDAWYIKQVALHTNRTDGIDDYYTKHAREVIYNYVKFNTQNNTYIKSTTLNHQLKIDFFSADGKLIALTDEYVTEYRKVFKEDILLDEFKDVSTYKIIMLLEDGFWRIRHLKKETSHVLEYERLSGRQSIEQVNGIKGVNYYPQKCPWDMYSDCFNKEDIIKDFALVNSAGLNTIRLFVPYKDFGGAHVLEERLEKLQMTLDALEENNLKAVVTLFDFYGNYGVLDWTLNQRHLETIVSRFKNHEAILAWDIKNEPDLDFESRGKNNVIAWLKEMVSYVKVLDSKHPVTIGWSSPEAGVYLKDYVDFVSFHYYQDVDEFEESYKTLKSKVGEKPIILQEFGMSSYRGVWNPFGASEDGQAEYHQKMQNAFKSHNVQFISWTLYDFEHIPTSVVGRLPWRKQAQKEYGFIDVKGAKKSSFKFISKH